LGQCLHRYSEFLKKQNKSSEAEKVLSQAEQYKLIGESSSRNDDIFPATLLRA
jgi:hypothetical protein